jgi:lipopolysaccharide transport protein LptA
MARFFLDRSVSGVLLSVLGSLSPVLAATPAIDPRTPITLEAGGDLQANLNTGTLEARDITLRQGTTVITAAHGSAKNLTESYNGQWELTGKVHIEFNNAVLDADSATVNFASDRLQKVHVKGTPAHFSHQLKDSPQRFQGRAATIDYDAKTSTLQMAGDTWYSNGRLVFESASVAYNMNDGTFSTPDRSKTTIDPDKRVPPPRTPDRATSQ